MTIAFDLNACIAAVNRVMDKQKGSFNGWVFLTDLRRWMAQ